MSIISNRRRIASGISTIAVAASLTFATPAIAQVTSGIQGHVGGAAAGSTVTFTDLNTGHTDSVKTDAAGNYLIVGLPPSTYRVQSGSTSQSVVVPLGQTVTVDLAPAAPAAAGAIVIVGARTKDVKTPATTTSVSRFQIENLPNGDRNFLNFAALAPGVTVSPPTLGGRARQVQAGAINSDNTIRSSTASASRTSSITAARWGKIIRRVIPSPLRRSTSSTSRRRTSRQSMAMPRPR